MEPEESIGVEDVKEGVQKLMMIVMGMEIEGMQDMHKEWTEIKENKQKEMANEEDVTQVTQEN